MRYRRNTVYVRSNQIERKKIPSEQIPLMTTEKSTNSTTAAVHAARLAAPFIFPAAYRSDECRTRCVAAARRACKRPSYTRARYDVADNVYTRASPCRGYL